MAGASTLSPPADSAASFSNSNPTFRNHGNATLAAHNCVDKGTVVMIDANSLRIACVYAGFLQSGLAV